MQDIQQSEPSLHMSSSADMRAGTDDTVHTMSMVLSRPVHFGTYTWSNNNVEIPLQVEKKDVNSTIIGALGPLVTLESPYSNFNSSALIVEKLANFRYFKSDFQFHVKVNSTPFVQGGLIIYWIPMYDQITTYRKDATNCYLSGASSMPHVTINLSSSNSATLVVPYAHIQSYLDLTSNDTDDSQSLGRLYVRPLVPLESADTSTSVSITVLGNFVNPEWRVPASGSLQAARVKHMKKFIHSYEPQASHTKTSTKNGKKHVSKTATTSNPHKKKPKAKPQVPKDTKEGEKEGPVTMISGVVSDVADVLTGVPVIGTIASGVGWVSRMVNRVASYFGWSKAIDLVMGTTVSNKEGYNMIHSEGKDQSTNLALIQDNSVILSADPTDVDEMSFEHIFSVENMLTRFNWSGSSAPGSRIFALEVCPVPQLMHNTTNNSLYVGSFAYGALQGKYWRGSIDYQIEFFKTQYHSGRIIMVYFPQFSENEVPLNYDNSMMTTNYSMIYDLNMPDLDNTDRFSFSIPYMSAQPWKRTYNELGDIPNQQTKFVTNGSFGIYSLNTLVHPDNVADRVRCVVSYKGGDDFEIAVPEKQVIPGYGIPDVPPESRDYQPQSDETLIPIVEPVEVKESTIGEYFTSFRQLVKRFTKVHIVGEGKTAGSKTTFGPLPHVQNEDGGFVYQNGSNAFIERVNSQLQMVGQMYTFYAGGTRAKIAYGSQTSRGKFGMVLRNGVFETRPDMDKVPHFTQSAALTGISEVTIPFYSRFSCKLVCPTQSMGTVTGPHSSVGMHLDDQTTFGSGISTAGIYEAASDDFTYFYMVSPGPVRSAKYEADISSL